MKKRVFTAIEAEHIILMAWGDTIPFEAIRREWGLTENEVIAFMRANQSVQTYTRWRKRVQKRSGAKSKHEKISVIQSSRQKLSV